MGKFIQSRIVSSLSLVLVGLCFVLGGKASAAHFYLATDASCVDNGIVEPPADQVSVWELCLENTSAAEAAGLPDTREGDGFFGFTFGLEVTQGDILITDWVDDAGMTLDTSTTWITGAQTVFGIDLPEGLPNPLHIGSVTLDVGATGGEVSADSDGQDVTELLQNGTDSPDTRYVEIFPTLVPEPATPALQAIMLLLLSALYFSRRSLFCWGSNSNSREASDCQKIRSAM